MNLNNLFYAGSTFPNILLIIMPLLILGAITFFQFKENLIVGLIAAIPFYLLFVFLYIFANFTTDTNGFNSTTLAIYGSFLLMLLPIDLIITQNIKNKMSSKTA